MNTKRLKSNLMLLLTAAIWGTAFVAQRVGAQYIGTFAFNGIRFALGSLSLLPVIIFLKKKNGMDPESELHLSAIHTIKAGVLAGTILFTASTFQQIGLTETSAGKAAFITGLYIVLVPVLGIFLRQRPGKKTWASVLLAATGLYLLCVTDDFSVVRSDLYEIIGAFFWAIHILLIDHYSNKVDVFKLSLYQYITCSVLSLISAVLFETIELSAVFSATVPILYGGILSVGVAYTLQAIGQKYAEPAQAAIILSMESVFANIGGFLILKENLGARGYLGCALMFAGMIFSQLQGHRKEQGPAKEQIEKAGKEEYTAFMN